MMKKFSHNGHKMVIERKGLGQYILTGENCQGVVGSYHYTDSTVWDECDNDDEPERAESAAAVAYVICKRNIDVLTTC